MRVLSEYEIALVSGGNSDSEMDDYPPIDVYGYSPFDPNQDYWPEPDNTDIGGGSGDSTNGADEIVVTGRDCPVDQEAASDALELLYNNSATARALIDAAGDNGVVINLVLTNPSGFGARPQYDPMTNMISWDAFQYQEGLNSDGSRWAISPIMILAHELVHAANSGNPAYQGAASEALVISIANQIAREINQATGSNFDTTRDTHSRNYQGHTNSITGTTFTIQRPGCT
jgi:hypothetical protein